MNESKRLLKNTSIIAIGNISTKLVSFLLLPFYTALLTTEEYGTFDYIISIATFCVPVVTILMDESVFRFLIDSNTEVEKRSVISTSFIITIIGSGVFLIVTVPIMIFLDYKYTSYAILYVLLNSLCGMINALLRGIGRTDQYAAFNFSTSVLQLVLNVIFIAVLHWGLLGMLRASILTQITVPIVVIVKMKLWEYVRIKSFDRALLKEMIFYSLPLIPNKVSWSIINLSDRIIIMNTIGSASSGLYAVSYKFPNLLDTVYGFFYQSWKESSARVLGNDDQDVFYNQIYDLLKKFMFALVVGMTAFMPLVFAVMINSSYYQAILYVPLLMYGTYFANMSGFYGGIFTAYKDTKIMGTTTAAAAIINLVVNIVLIATIGLYAAAISTLVANVMVYLYRKVKVKRYVALHEDLKETVLSAVVAVLVLVLFYMQNMVATIINCIIAMVFAIVTNRKLLRKSWKYIKGRIKR